MSEVESQEVELLDNAALEESAESNMATISGNETMTKSELLAKMVSYASKMNKDTLAQAVDTLTKSNDEIYASTQQAKGDAGKNKASIKSSGAPAQAASSVKEDLELVFGSTDLSEDFRLKTEALFEAAVATRVELERAKLEESFAETASVALDEAKAEMVENIDAYLNYAVAEWIAENKLAVENNIRTKVMESFLTGLKDLFVEHYVDIPEDKVDVVESMAARIEELEANLQEKTEAANELQKALEESEVTSAADELSEGMTDTQKEKFTKLIEAVDFTSASEFRRKAEIIKETYFSGTGEVKAVADQLLNEQVDEPAYKPVYTDPMMADYVSSLTRFAKK